MSVELRQWCWTCQAATVKWTDTWAQAHCSGCDPDDGRYDWRDVDGDDDE